MTTGIDVQSITRSRKRGRDEVDERELDARSFTVKSDALDPFAAPRTFTPICLLSRAQLPLAYLDTSSSGSRLFAAHVSALESAHEHDDDATIFVAAERKEQKLYAIERVKRRVYVLCRLGEWVNEDDVVARSKCLLQDESRTKRRAVQFAEKGKPWWTSAAVDMARTSSGTNATRPKVMLKTVPDIVDEQALPVCEVSNTEATSMETALPVESAPQSPAELTQELAKQYLEALYLSRTSLAYFTKGPLSRARAAFAVLSSPTANAELVEFLRASVLTSSTMDKKFKDNISSTVKELAAESIQSPEHPKKAKRKRKWKPKRDKYGFFTDEKDIVERWWVEHDILADDTSSTETTDESLRRRLPKLRSRETFMQLILILETLALESSLQDPAVHSHQRDIAIESQDGDTQHDESQHATEKKSKGKKKQDLPSLLETLLDKLCIWHSLESHSPAKKGGTDADDRDDTHDELRSFCVEVVLPFYSSRIPEHAAVVNKKLGGPTAPPPVKRKSTMTRKPGEPAGRPAPEKRPRKPLSRVATETFNNPHSKNMPALNRSATDTDALTAHIKRETSETPLESIPAANQQRRPRQSLMHTLDSSRRQVDLNAMSQANDAKMQRKAEMQEKMQSAINMLRKPNRAAALAEVRSQTDESFAKATAAAKSRPGGAAQRARITQRPQITATPSHRRAINATPYRNDAHLPPVDPAQSSGTTHVPSSSARIAADYDAVPANGFAVPQTGHRPRYAAPSDAAGVEETPSRGFAKFMPSGLAREPGTLDSPTASRKVVAPPSKPVRPLSLGVAATPMNAALVAASPNVQRRDELSEAAGKRSIYDSLGWDEEYEDLA